MKEIAFDSAVRLALLIRRRQVGCLELLDHFIDRIDGVADLLLYMEAALFLNGRLYILTEERMQENGRQLASKVSSRVEDLPGIVYPIIQAPFGGFASQRLTAAVSNLGASVHSELAPQ